MKFMLMLGLAPSLCPSNAALISLDYHQNYFIQTLNCSKFAFSKQVHRDVLFPDLSFVNAENYLFGKSSLLKYYHGVNVFIDKINKFNQKYAPLMIALLNGTRFIRPQNVFDWSVVKLVVVSQACDFLFDARILEDSVQSFLLAEINDCLDSSLLQTILKDILLPIKNINYLQGNEYLLANSPLAKKYLSKLIKDYNDVNHFKLTLRKGFASFHPEDLMDWNNAFLSFELSECEQIILSKNGNFIQDDVLWIFLNCYLKKKDFDIILKGFFISITSDNANHYIENCFVVLDALPDTIPLLLDQIQNFCLSNPGKSVILQYVNGKIVDPFSCKDWENVFMQIEKTECIQKVKNFSMEIIHDQDLGIPWIEKNECSDYNQTIDNILKERLPKIHFSQLKNYFKGKEEILNYNFVRDIISKRLLEYNQDWNTENLISLFNYGLDFTCLKNVSIQERSPQVVLQETLPDLFSFLKQNYLNGKYYGTTMEILFLNLPAICRTVDTLIERKFIKIENGGKIRNEKFCEFTGPLILDRIELPKHNPELTHLIRNRVNFNNQYHIEALRNHFKLLESENYDGYFYFKNCPSLDVFEAINNTDCHSKSKITIGVESLYMWYWFNCCGEEEKLTIQMLKKLVGSIIHASYYESAITDPDRMIFFAYFIERLAIGLEIEKMEIQREKKYVVAYRDEIMSHDILELIEIFGQVEFTTEKFKYCCYFNMDSIKCSQAHQGQEIFCGV